MIYPKSNSTLNSWREIWNDIVWTLTEDNFISLFPIPPFLLLAWHCYYPLPDSPRVLVIVEVYLNGQRHLNQGDSILNMSWVKWGWDIHLSTHQSVYLSGTRVLFSGHWNCSKLRRRRHCLFPSPCLAPSRSHKPPTGCYKMKSLCQWFPNCAED